MNLTKNFSLVELTKSQTAERTYSDTVSYKCIKALAEVEINNDGSKSIKKIILK